MATMSGDIALRSFDNRYTLTVTITREFRFRLWLGLALIKLGGRIMRIGVEVKESE